MVEPKRRGLWFKLLIGFCVVVLIIAGWLFLERIRGQGALRKYEKELISRGEKLRFVELLLPLPDGPNKAIELVGICGSFQTGAVLTLNAPRPMECVVPGKAWVITKEAHWFEREDQGPFTWKQVTEPESFERLERKTVKVTWEQVGQDLERNRGVLKELRETVRSPELRYPINYRGVGTLLPHLSRQRAAAQWLSASALHRIRTKDVSGAIDDIESIVMLAGLTEHEPILISQLVRNALVEIAVHNCWPLLQHDASNAELVRLQQIFSNIDTIDPIILGMQGERAMRRDTFDMIRSEQIKLENLVGATALFADGGETPGALDKVPYADEMKGAFREQVIYPTWRHVFSYEDQHHASEEMQQIIDATRAAKEARSAATLKLLEAILNEKGKPGGDYESWRYFLTGLLVPGTSKAGTRAFRAQTHCEIIVAAVALKRYHMRHKKYPNSLDELVPEFVPRVPLDWMDGKPLRYRVDGDQFVLWSVGPNGRDDRGSSKSKPPFGWMLGPDDVWPRAASEEEVAAHRESQKKR
jgi:hypothetical protein